MKLSTVVLAALAPFAVLAHPAPVEEAAAAPTLPSTSEPDNHIQKRDVDAVVKVDGLRYRKCPRTSCTAVGQYPKGKKIKLKCYTRDNTTPVNGDRGWGLVSNGYWVALSHGNYVHWYSPLPYCHQV